MARNTFEDNGWIPEENDSKVLEQVRHLSAVERYARGIPMKTDVMYVPRSGNVSVATVAKGASYGEDEAVNDSVLLTARKHGSSIRIAEEDLADSPLNIIQQKQLNWASSYAKYFDNASLGVSGAENGTTIPYTSVYKAIRTTNSDTSYTADANLIQTGGAVTYEDLSGLLELVEVGDYWDESQMVVIAHPSFRAALREIKDAADHYVFVQGQGGDRGTPGTLFGLPIHFTHGAKTHGVASGTPTGNPLMVVANRNFMIRGDRANAEYQTAGANAGPGFSTDETIIKMRARKGFVVGNENAFGVLQITA